MAKQKARGLPTSFALDVPESVLNAPVQLGDYLDEEVPTPTPARHAPLPSFPPRIEPVRPPQNVLSIPQSRLRPPPPEPAEESISALYRTPPRPVNRKQLNMNPETLRMVEELLDYIQTYSVQKDAKASEMFHGLVASLYDARELLSLADVPPRGRWGTPTAHAFPIALKNCFQAAIAAWCRRHEQ